ncbi:MAG: hypothetical protein K2L02_05015 [Clostridia bacterium]|nr:hypothetical protein [Clostridia bacterium]
MFFCGFFATKNTRKTEAYNSTNAPNNNIGEITLSGYESRKDGLVFDYDQLEILYGKIVEAATGTATATANLKTAKAAVSNKSSSITASASTGNTLTQPRSLDFGMMTANLADSQPITLKFGGYDWTVMYATTNVTAGGTTKAGDLVLTLWMNDNVKDNSSNYITSKWSAAPTSEYTNVTYPTGMYSTSVIRVNALNAGGDDGSDACGTSGNGDTYYADSASSLSSVSLASRRSNQFAKFTLSNNVLKSSSNPQPSLVGFLTQPKNIEYQKAENWVWSYIGAGSPYLSPNDAWGTGANGIDGPDTSSRHNGTGGWYSGSGGKNVMGDLLANAHYYDWAEDYLWLPSMTETGYDYTPTEKGQGLWGNSLTDAVLKSTMPSGTGNTVPSWLRSGWGKEIIRTQGLTYAGLWTGVSAETVGYIRPALHLNLSQAELSAAGVPIEEPTVKKYTTDYDGDNQDLSTESWYDSDVFDDSNFCAVTYYNDKNKKVTPKEVGTYRVVIEFKGDRYYWKDTPAGQDDKKREFEFTINPKELEVKLEVDDTTDMPKFTILDDPFDGDTVNGEIHYYDTSGNHIGTDTSQLQGKTDYEAEVQFDNDNYVPKYVPSLGGDRLEFTNPSTPVNVYWTDSQGNKTDGTQEYTGAIRTFYLKYNSTVVQVTPGTGVTYDGYNGFKATNAGKYQVTLSLVNKQDYVWGSDMGKKAAGTTDNVTLEFEIKPIELTLVIDSMTPEDGAVAMGGKCDVTIDLPSLKSGTLDLMIYAYAMEGAAPLTVCEVTLKNSQQFGAPCEFSTQYIDTPGTYHLGVRPLSGNDPLAKNYTFKLNGSYTITVKDVQESGINWKLSAGGRPAGSMATDDMTGVSWDKQIVYDGKAYSFTVNAGGLGSVDTSYNADGFTNGYKTIDKTNNSVLTDAPVNAGSYETYVRILSGSESFVYRINWEIEKAKFDLSNVSWLYDGKIPYNEDGMSVALENLPKGLHAEIDTITPTEVGDSGRATVTFTVDDINNYVTPVQGQANTYIFEGGDLPDFEWEKNWEVVKHEIPVNWTVGIVTTEDGNKVNAKVLVGDYGKYVEYVYYEANGNGDLLDPTNPLPEPVVVENQIKIYIAKVSIKSNWAGQYAFKQGTQESDLYSPVFEAGRKLNAVKVEAKKTTYIYWGSAVNFQYKVTSGSVTEDAFDVTYYRGMVRILGAPTDPGNYTAQLSLKTRYAERFYIDGTTSFDFKIERATIVPNWNENVKPPVLNLTENQAQYVTYEYRNADGDTIAFNSLRRPGTYAVAAKIRDTSKYIFDNGTAYTEWKEFTVRQGDTVTDPSSSLPPYLGTTDPNDPDGGNTQTTGDTVTFTLLNSTGAKGEEARFSNDKNLPDEAFVIRYYRADGTLTNCNDEEVFEVRIMLVGRWASEYKLAEDRFAYTVLGEGGTTTTTPNGEGDNPSGWTIESILPIILSGISLVLIVVFAVMAFNNASAAKEAREKTKKLAVMSYSVSPVGLLALLFGLSEGNWWIIAGVLMGLALVTAIVAFMFKGKKKKALAALSDEEARIAEEKEIAREEKEMAREAERDRRDNELRMMFASMQQSYQQPQGQGQLIDYDMLQNMINSSVSALLPGLQQLQALPPASFDVKSAEAQKEIDGLHAQIAEQQEMLAQILQNQQNYVMPLYEEEVVDDISWLGVSEERISLEESYGALSDEGKRAYYETGSYIMSKPHTSQNDGRYAVLFKYRGRTVFKLAIKDDAPVLYYPAGNGREEIRVADSSSLERAKGMIDRIVMKVDNEL